MKLSDVRAAYRWPWDHTAGGKYSAVNDNDWVLQGASWTHRTDLEWRAAYYKQHGWTL